MTFSQLSASLTQNVQWETDLNIATARAEREQRPLFLHFIGNDSPAARQMEQEVFSQPTIAAQLNANFVMVKVNAAENPALAQRFSITSIPADLVIRPNGQVIHSRVGVIPADRFAEYLAFLQKMIQNDRGAQPAQSAVPAAAAPGTVLPPPAPQRELLSPPASAPHSQPPNTPPSGNFADPFAQQSHIQQPHTQQPHVQQHTAQPQTMPAANMQPNIPQHGQYLAQTTQPNGHANVQPHSHPVHSGNVPMQPQETAARPTVQQNQAFSQSFAGESRVADVRAADTAANVPAPAKTTVEVPLGLEGFCPVTLSTEERWITGNPAYCTMYQGHIFRFASFDALTTFARSPSNYVPVAMGEDIVLKVERNQRVNGDRKFGACFQGRIFLFASQETLNAFAERPDYYMEIGLRYETARKEQPVPIVY